MAESGPFQDSYARIDSAQEAYNSLQSEVDKFMTGVVRKMLRGYDRKRGSYVVQLPPAIDALGEGYTVSGRPCVIFAQIVENLSSALDYIVFELSESRNPTPNKRGISFVIASKKELFDQQTKKRLKYLDERERDFVERLQPYHGNDVIRLLRDLTSGSKHRELTVLKQSGRLNIVLAARGTDKYAGWNVVPVDEQHSYFFRHDSFTVLLRGKYDAIKTVETLIEFTKFVVDSFRDQVCQGTALPDVRFSVSPTL